MRTSFIVSALFLLLSITSCSSINGDAEKAADLKKRSQECIRENDMEKAERLFNESQIIIDKYIGTDDYDEFYKRFLEHSAINAE